MVRLLERMVRRIGDEGISSLPRRGWRRVKAECRMGREIVAGSFENYILSWNRGFLCRVRPDFATVEDLLQHLRVKPTFALPFREGNKSSFLSKLRSQFPGETDRVLREAERICQHQLTMLGQHLCFTGREIDWNVGPPGCDPWPRDHVTRIKKWLYSERRQGDWLPVWELNRHQFLLTLAKAYWITADDRYSSEFCDLVESWIRQNPVQWSINWFSAMEVSVRLISWATAFYAFRESDVFLERIGGRFLRSLYQQTAYLRSHLTVDSRSRNNHIIGEAAGLFCVGVLFPEFKESAEWAATGLSLLEEEAVRQTWEDGFNKEQTTGYHRYVLELLLLVVVLQRRGASAGSEVLEQVLERMIDYVLWAVAPDGRLIQVGDSGEGHVVNCDEGCDYWDPGSLLSIGAALFKRPEFKYRSKGFTEESYWLLGENGLRSFNELERHEPLYVSRAFPKGGHYFLRDSWSDNSDFLMMRAGEFGLGGEGHCAHAHCDLLSIVLWIEGKPILVDSGTYSYHGQWRDPFRLTSAHNTVRIDGVDQAVPLRDFFWENVPAAVCDAFGPTHVVARLVKQQVSITRDIRHPLPGEWHIVDTIAGNGEHEVNWSFNFSPDLQIERVSASAVSVTRQGQPALCLTIPLGVRLDVSTGWYSEYYRSKVQNQRLEAAWSGAIDRSGVRFEWRLAKNNEQTEIEGGRIHDVERDYKVQNERMS